MAVMPITMYDHMATNLNGKIVLCGGHIGLTGVYTNRCWYYDAKLNLWIPMANMPHNMYNSAVVTLGNLVRFYFDETFQS